MEEISKEILLEVINDIIMVLDKKGRITYINKSGNKILGYKKNDLIGKDWFNTCLPPANISNVKKVFNKIIKGKIKSVEIYENPIVTKKGKIKYIKWHNTFLKNKNGKIIGTLSSGADITERKQIEVDLKKHRKFMDSIIENAPFGIMIINSKGYPEYVNTAMQKISNVSYNDYIKINLLKSSTYKKIGLIDKLKSAFKGEKFKLLNIKYISPVNKKERIINFTGIPIKLDNVIKVLLIVEDLSKVIIFQDKLKNNIEELEKFKELTIGRELRMEEIRKENLRLKNKIEKLEARK